MIISTPQAVKAINDIKDVTGWTDGYIARKADLHPMVVSKLMSGETKNLTDASIEKIENLLTYVTKHTEEPND